MVGITIFEFLSWLFDKLKNFNWNLNHRPFGWWVYKLLQRLAKKWHRDWISSNLRAIVWHTQLTHFSQLFTVTSDCPLWIVDFYRSPKATTPAPRPEHTGETEPMKKENSSYNSQSTAAPTSFPHLYFGGASVQITHSAWNVWNFHILPCQSKSSRTPLVPHDGDSKRCGLLPRLVHSWISVKSWSWFLDVQSLRSGLTKWAPSYQWSYHRYRWPYTWVTGVITAIRGVIT